MSAGFRRRDFLRAAGLTAAGLVALDRTSLIAAAAPNSIASNAGGLGSAAPKPVLTLAHLTDIHVKPTDTAREGMASVLDTINKLDPKPDLVFNGGDLIMDALAANEEKTRAQWEIAKRLFAENNKIPVKHVIGNHDIWGWNKTKAGTTGKEPLYGKAWALQELELAKPYYSFDQAGWHFIVLDSVQERGGGAYKPVLDDEQFEWLKGELQSTPKTTPILIISHVPIVSVSAMFFKEEIVKDYQFNIIGALIHQDMKKLESLLFQHKNVRVCLSGHIHLLDHVVYNGIHYVCTGAVSGDWWSGDFHETAPGYGLVKLYADGSFEHEYKTYPYPKVEKKPKATPKAPTPAAPAAAPATTSGS